MASTVPPTRRVSIVLEPGAEQNGLACMLGELVRENAQTWPAKSATLANLHGRVGISLRDAEVSLTLEFDRGTLAIHDGLLAGCSLVVVTEAEKVTGLSLLQFRMGLPHLFDEAGRQLVSDLLKRRLRIKGAFRHPILLIRLTKIMSIHG